MMPGTEQPNGPQVSIVVCTYNPDRELLAQAIGSIVTQTASPEVMEVLVVDNNSTPALQLSDLQPEGEPKIRLIRESRQGLTFARIAGIRATEGSWLIFVDDDNRLAADYVEKALDIAGSNSDLGAFGGAVEATTDRPIPRWVEPLMEMLGVRDHGAEPITSHEARRGPHDPIGVGFVVRRSVAERFVQLVESDIDAGGLGRSGSSLLSAEDTLLARCSNMLGMANSYQPSLRTFHHIAPDRLRFRYLAKLMEAHGRSYVRLNRIIGHPSKSYGFLVDHLRAAAILLIRTLTRGRSGFVHSMWRIGFLRELYYSRR